MKTQGKDIADIARIEPQVHIVYDPARLNMQKLTPGILIMVNPGKAKYEEEKRFDRYSGIRRPQSMGQELSVSVLFSVYDAGTRERGFVDSYEKGKPNYSLVTEATEEALQTLLDWMDEFKQNLINCARIPRSDLAVDPETIGWNLYSDQNYNTDKRPLYYGFVDVLFNCYADDGSARTIQNSGIEETIEDLLD